LLGDYGAMLRVVGGGGGGGGGGGFWCVGCLTRRVSSRFHSIHCVMRRGNLFFRYGLVHPLDFPFIEGRWVR